MNLFEEISHAVMKQRHISMAIGGEFKTGIVVYIDIPTYHQLMQDVGRNAAYEITRKSEICGAKIYRVMDGNHGWKIYHVGMPQ